MSASYPFPRAICGVDVVVLTLEEVDGRLRLATLLARRANEPFAGDPALPGAHVRTGTDASLEAVAQRTLAEKCGIVGAHVEQLATWGDAARDPRDWSVTVGYAALLPRAAIPPRPDTLVVPVEGLGGLPFDHDAILAAAVARLRGKATYTGLPATMLPERFTIPQLHGAYEAATGRAINPASFRRVVVGLEASDAEGRSAPFIVADGASVATSTKPASTYRLGSRRPVRFHQRF